MENSAFLPRIRGKVIEQAPNVYGWEIYISMDPDRVVSDLGVAKLVEHPEMLVIECPTTFSTRALALIDLKKQHDEVSLMVADTLRENGVKIQGHRDLKTGEFTPMGDE